MKYLKVIAIFILTLNCYSQTKNFLDLPYIETMAVSDTLVTPDNIFLKIIVTEKDTKGRVSVEELEAKMVTLLSSYGIDTKKQVVINDVSSNFKKYFLRQQDILKTKEFLLNVYDAKTVGKVVIGLEDLGISNVTLDRTEYSKQASLQLILKTRTVQKAKNQALAMTKATNQKVGDALFISDLSTNEFDMINSLNGKVAGVVITGYGGKEKYEQPDIDIQKIQLAAKVNVKFKLQ